MIKRAFQSQYVFRNQIGVLYSCSIQHLISKLIIGSATKIPAHSKPITNAQPGSIFLCDRQSNTNCYLLDFLCFVGSTNRYDWSDSLVGGNGFPAVDVTSSPVPFPLELITSYCPLMGVRSPGLCKKD